jgi:CBS domain-containing protein
MTLTLAVLLVEVTDDSLAMLPMMFVLVCAKAVGDICSASFDDAMIRMQELPYLEEQPPHEFDVLTARDVMCCSVVVLREKERVGHLLAVLKRTGHNGFPIVDPGRSGKSTFFAGLILRRQLLVLLHERVWELQAQGKWLGKRSRDLFIDSHFALSSEVLVSISRSLSPEDRDASLDLRPFMDPSPYVVNELMPLRRVYRLFNEIGVRHLVVVDCREQVVGIMTRKDIQPETIEKRALAVGDVQLLETRAKGAFSTRHLNFGLGNSRRSGDGRPSRRDATESASSSHIKGGGGAGSDVSKVSKHSGHGGQRADPSTSSGDEGADAGSSASSPALGLSPVDRQGRSTKLENRKSSDTRQTIVSSVLRCMTDEIKRRRSSSEGRASSSRGSPSSAKTSSDGFLVAGRGSASGSVDENRRSRSVWHFIAQRHHEKQQTGSLVKRIGGPLTRGATGTSVQASAVADHGKSLDA